MAIVPEAHEHPHHMAHGYMTCYGHIAFSPLMWHRIGLAVESQWKVDICMAVAIWPWGHGLLHRHCSDILLPYHAHGNETHHHVATWYGSAWAENCYMAIWQHMRWACWPPTRPGICDSR